MGPPIKSIEFHISVAQCLIEQYNSFYCATLHNVVPRSQETIILIISLVFFTFQ